MKVDFDFYPISTLCAAPATPTRSHVVSEVDQLTDVLLCPPHHLAPVPCCAVTQSSLRAGFEVCAATAADQHRKLVELLESEGVRCHLLEPVAGLPDMSFSRDIAVATPFGLIALNPALPHRRREVEALARACERWHMPLGRILTGSIEGGDVCVAREGLLLVGTSGERTTAAGIRGLVAPFRELGWDVLVCPFDAEQLHLDTMFCMVDHDQAIACVELLDPKFVSAVEAQGISILPVPATSSASLGCNVLSLGHRRIVANAADLAVTDALDDAGYDVLTVDISQFTACGGGVHCLTQPIRRVAGARDRSIPVTDGNPI